jgi:hemoglobin/transferrin/lactoferrin receptor protein
MPSRPLPLVIVIASIGAGPAAFANETTTLETVTVAASLDGMPSSGLREIDPERLKKNQARDLQDVFADEPSVSVGTGARNGQKIFLRGIEDLNLNVQIDGARQGANNFHHQGRITVDPYLYRQIAVETGAVPADAGPGALAGAVRFETVDAQDLLRPGQKVGGRLGAQYESADRSLGGLASAYGMLGEKIGLLAYIRNDDADLLRVGGGDKLPASDGRRRSHLLKATMLDQAGHSLWLASESNLNTGGSLRANWPWATNNATQKIDNQKFLRETHTLRHRYQSPGSSLIDIQSTIYANESAITLDDNPFTAINGDRTDWLTRSQGADLRNTAVFDLAGSRHAVTVGIDYFLDRGIRIDATQRWNETARNLGFYLQDRIDFGRVRISGGLRSDHYKTRYANGYTTSGQTTSPNLSGEWDLLPEGGADLTVHAGYGESIRGGKLNQSAWLSKYFLPPAFTTPRPFTLGENGKLDPERGIQKQLGIKWHDHDMLVRGDHAGIDLTLFRTSIRDYQIIPGEGLGPAAITDRITNAPADITTRGYEIRAHWGNQALLVSASYSHAKSRDYTNLPLDTTGDSARIGASVGDRLMLDAEWKARADLRLGYTLTAVKRLKDVRPDRPEKPGYAIHGIRLQWTPSSEDALTLNLGVDNLFDKKYAEHTSVLSIVSGEEIASWESGRNIKLGVDWRF